MHVQEIEEFFLKSFSAYLKTITEISLDTSSSISLCENNQTKFFSFDGIAREIYKTINKPVPCTPDLILFNKAKNLVIFVEFKNGKVESQNVRLKLLEGSLFVLARILKLECCEILKNIPITYLLVYNYDSNLMQNKTIDNILKDLTTEEVRFGLDILKNDCFTSLKTIQTHPFSHEIYKKLMPHGYT